jgi:hypothetical protein
MENSDFHDTRLELSICFDKLYDAIYDGTPLSLLDLVHLKPFITACREVVSLYDDGMINGIIDENGQLTGA